MVVNIVIAGQTQCTVFAQACLVADYLAQNLPDFKYIRIEKKISDYKPWLAKINRKYKWQHFTSPIIWKEVLIDGSLPFYIGGGTEFWEYCYSYYNFDNFMSQEKFTKLYDNMHQLKNKLKLPQDHHHRCSISSLLENLPRPKNSINITICGAGYALCPYIIAGLLELSVGTKYVSKIYLYDCYCSEQCLEEIVRDCNLIDTNNPLKVVKIVQRLGIALTNSDIFIIVSHIPIHPKEPCLGEWLTANKDMMLSIAEFLNGSAGPSLRIIIPNVGPACFNATVLIEAITNDCKNNVVVATSDLGLEIVQTAAEIAEVPMKNMFCPPVWGFVGVNQLVDINTTYHEYNSLVPYKRYAKVRKSTLLVGELKPELRTLQYLMHFDDTLWGIIAEKRRKKTETQMNLGKAEAVVNVVRLWLFDCSPSYVVNLGIVCDGSFGLNFNGVFSQPARNVDDKWVPASEYPLPQDKHMQLPYLESIAEKIMKMYNDGSLKDMF